MSVREHEQIRCKPLQHSRYPYPEAAAMNVCMVSFDHLGEKSTDFAVWSA